MKTQIAKIAVKARKDRNFVFTSLAHHITADRLWDSLNKIPPRTAVGVDAQEAAQAKESFGIWSGEQIQQVHNKGYRPPPTRRVYIPKPGKDAKRPIAIPTVQDRCLQKSVADILESIYEQDFLPCSYGGRPNRSAHMALANLQEAIKKKASYIFEADLKNFFGSLNQRMVEQFLNHRVRDPRITKLIRSWIKAGVMEEGLHQPTEAGVPQGGPISVLISNIYLHYVLDLWIEKKVKPRMRGEVHYIRYLDDFVLSFQIRSDAVRFRDVLTKRLNKFDLSLEPSKTRLVRFGKFSERDAKARGKQPETINFLGFCLYNTKTRKGKYRVGMKTEKTRFRRSCSKMKTTLLRIRHLKITEQVKVINAILRGHYRYYGIGGNSRCIGNFFYFSKKCWRKVLSTRSQNGNIKWEKFNHLLKVFPLCQPRISIPYTVLTNLATL